MSMRHYAFDDYGLVLDNETAKIIASKLLDNYVDDAETDWIYEICNYGFGEYICDFTGEAQEIDEQGHFCCESIEYDFGVVAYVQINHYPTLFSKAYNNMGEIVEEFKNKLSKYLPEDFDYRSRIRHIYGTYYA